MLSASTLTAPHAFSIRPGGVSLGEYAAVGLVGSERNAGGLNMDGRQVAGLQDDPANVAENRHRLRLYLQERGAQGALSWPLSLLDQVHGDRVITIERALAREHAPLPQADAQVSAERGVLLGIMTADCFPVLLHDPVAGVVGAAHAGWRGTAAHIAARTVEAMQALGAVPHRIQAAIGVGISTPCYPVGAEVVQAMDEAGLGEHLHANNRKSAIHADLAGANAASLRRAGVPAGHIWQAGRCSTEPEFYSYRRDNGRTGRMLAVIGLPVIGLPEAVTKGRI